MMGPVRPEVVDGLNDNTLELTHVQLDDDTFAEAWDQGQTLKFDEAVVLRSIFWG